MPKPHKVSRGEHLPGIAARYGFGNWKTIWEDPANAELAKQRQPCLLREGDELTIPDKTAKSESLAPRTKHTITVIRPRIQLRLVLKDAADKPRAGVSGQLHCGDQVFEVSSDGDGLIEQEIPVKTGSCKLVLDGVETPLLVGHLGPNDRPSGWRARLNNLGYDAGHVQEGEDDEDGDDDEDDEEDEDVEADEAEATTEDDDMDDESPEAEDEHEHEDRLTIAVAEFQLDNKLDPTGVCDDATQAKLLKIHGC